MRIGREDVKRIGALARLELAESELEGLAVQLSTVLDHVAALEDVVIDVSAESPDTEAAPRADITGPDPLIRPPADFAPAFVEGFFAVPRLQAFAETADRDPADA